MKKNLIIGALTLSFASLASAVDIKIPRNASEDTDKIMTQKYWDIWNDDVQKKIDADIEANRKADACVNIGKIKDGTEVVVEQISHDFIFGAHFFNFDQLGDDAINAKYKALYGTLFNSATVAFYWAKFEMEPNRPRFENEYWDEASYWNNCQSPKTETHWRRPAPEKVIDYCKQMGIRIHGHPMIWDNRSWHHPVWLFDSCLTDPAEREKMKEYIVKPQIAGNKSIREQYSKKFWKETTPQQLSKEFPIFAENLNKAFEKRIVELSKYYGDKVDSWDIVNESAGAYKGGYFKNAEGCTLMKTGWGIMPADFTFKSFQTAQKNLPANVKLNINDYWTDEAYREQMQGLIARGCKIDIVGSQMHLFNPKESWAMAEGKIPAKASPEGIWKMMKILDVGKPIHLSEITITAGDTTPKGRMLQAILTRNLYRLWFSIKPMMGITWWNVVDDCGAPGEPSLSGLFTRGMNPKPAYYALNELINKEWKTNFNAKPDSDGNIKFRGFKGKYRFSWYDADGNEQFKIVEVK